MPSLTKKPTGPATSATGPVDGLTISRYAGHFNFARLPRIEDVPRHDVPVVGVPFDTVDIDVLDPAHAPDTGTPEAGGTTGRELLEIVRGLEGLNSVGADIVEVASAYDYAELPRGGGRQSCLRARFAAREVLLTSSARYATPAP